MRQSAFGCLRRHLVLFVLNFAALKIAKGGFVRVGPCVVRWGSECPTSYIKFFLFNSENGFKGQQITPTKLAVSKSDFRPDLVNKLIIHGYNTDMNVPQLVYLREEYLKAGGYNVWVVDWSKAAVGPCYPITVSNLNYVGKCVAELAKVIEELSDVSGEHFLHIIGFSLGAHMASFIATHLRPLHVPRITGLDPALPLFTTSNKDRKLDKEDADFVDIIHTNVFLRGHYEEMGHVDFYINGGVHQPGCRTRSRVDSVSCSHHRAPAYLAESVRSDVGFYGWKCDTYRQFLSGGCKQNVPDTIMGERCHPQSRGIYMVVTNDRPPYAVGKNEDEDIDVEPLDEELVKMHFGIDNTTDWIRSRPNL